MHRSPKNIVICCDGTGNDYFDTPSNVLRLYGLLWRSGGRQVACYHPGIGTLPRPGGWRRVQRAKELLRGDGVIENVIELYSYLRRRYEPGDRVFLFGFSRGAFTARALAGMLHVCGLVHRDDEHLVPYAAGLYQTSEGRIRRALQEQPVPPGDRDHGGYDRPARSFKSLLAAPVEIAFLGVWDTVKAYGWVLPRSFPALRHNPGVEMVRHAVALDERRAVFQVTGWGERAEEVRESPRVKEVWFAGDHSDVGGGHEEGNSPLTDATLAWMLGEAGSAGLLFDESRRTEIDEIVANGRRAPLAPAHDLQSERRLWRLPIPRVELVNRTYPPTRSLRWSARDPRRPGDHAEGAAVLFHDTVRERAEVDQSYSPERLLARTPPGEPGARPLRYAYASDGAITRFAS